MLSSFSIKVMSLPDYYKDNTLQETAIKYYKLLWVNNTRGLLFIKSNSNVHIKYFESGGTIIMFSDEVMNSFFNHYHEQLDMLIFDPYERQINLSLKQQTFDNFNVKAKIIASGLLTNEPDEVLHMILYSMLVHCSLIFDEEKNPGSHSSEALIIRNLLELLRQHYKTERKTAFYSAALKMPIIKLNKIAKKIEGLLVPDIAHKYRFLEAKRLLQNPDLNIKQIALELNFKEQGHFAMFFKSHAGITPTEYRKRKLNNIRKPGN